MSAISAGAEEQINGSALDARAHAGIKKLGSQFVIRHFNRQVRKGSQMSFEPLELRGKANPGEQLLSNGPEQNHPTVTD